MAGIFGVLNLNDTERVFANTVGQSAIYDAAQQVLAQHNAELMAAIQVFVEAETEDHKRRYMLPGGGRLQRRGSDSPTGAVKASGSWDVAFPLEDFGAQVAADMVDWAYMTVQDVQRHLDTVMQQDINTVRFELLKALLNNAQDTFSDPLYGSLSIEPLANGDSVLYPPVLGSETEATDDHYLESGYAAGSISDSNDPYETIVDELEEHFGTVSGGGSTVVFINNAQSSITRTLTDFDPVVDQFIRPGDDTDVPIGPPVPVPGRVLGRHNAGCWVVEWRWIPANYMVGVYLDAPPPLLMRVDPADTGLPRGLALVSDSDTNPFVQSHYRHRFGFGAGNRLNGVVMELGTGGSYTPPSGYA